MDRSLPDNIKVEASLHDSWGYLVLHVNIRTRSITT